MFTSMYGSLYHHLSRKTLLFSICLSPPTNHSLTYWNLANLCHYHQQNTYYHHWNLLSNLSLISFLQNVKNTSQFLLYLVSPWHSTPGIITSGNTLLPCLPFYKIFSDFSHTLSLASFWAPSTLHIPLGITVYQGSNSLLIWTPQISKISRIIVMWFGTDVLHLYFH